MGDKTGISWTDATWNPVRGCSRVSEGCRNCYAERVAARFSDVGMPYAGLADRTRPGSKWTGEVRLVAEHLADPLRWKRPRRIFVNSMSDLFHEKLTNEEIAAVFGVMAAAPQHTFQVLTKRAERMRAWFEWLRLDSAGPDQAWDVRAITCWRHAVAALPALGSSTWDSELYAIAHTIRWPLPNVWLGVSVENQDAAEDRIPELLDTPAAVRFLSCEPLLGEVSLFAFLKGATRDACLEKLGGSASTPGVDWVITGCESGPGARPCDFRWLRALRDQCAESDVPFFLKQAGHTPDQWFPGGVEERRVATLIVGADTLSRTKGRLPDGSRLIELPYLDGEQHAAFPEVP